MLNRVSLHEKSFGKGEKGIGLVEVIFALGVSVLVVTSLVSLSIFSLKSSNQANLLLNATKRSTAEIEQIRAYRDSIAVDPSRTWADDFINSLEGCSTLSSGCHIDSSFNVVSGTETSNRVSVLYYATDINGNQLNSAAPVDVVRITIEASYVAGGIIKYVHNYTELSNWFGD